MGISTEQFRTYIRDKIEHMDTRYIDLISGEIHREFGEYPGKNHSMPNCCEAMTSLMIPGDIILKSPRKGKGASLVVRYYKRCQ